MKRFLPQKFGAILGLLIATCCVRLSSCNLGCSQSMRGGLRALMSHVYPIQQAADGARVKLSLPPTTSLGRALVDAPH
eukprot:4148500-Amphidinium_carterae.1